MQPHQEKQEEERSLKMKRHDLFATPVFVIPVDINQIEVPYQTKDFAPTFESGLDTTYRKQKVPEQTYAYLRSVIAPVLNSLSDPWRTMKFIDLWRNRYTKTDYQSGHIHPHVQWSFIIYEDVPSKTIFMNPALHLIQNQSHHPGSKDHPIVWHPRIEPENMVLFPSWIEHMVIPGNEGHTIAGNIELKS